MDRIISLILVVLLNIQIVSFIGYAHGTQPEESLFPIQTIIEENKPLNNSTESPIKKIRVKDNKTSVVQQPMKVRRVMNQNLQNPPLPKKTAPVTEEDFAREFDNLPFEHKFINVLQSDTKIINHKKSLLYQTWSKIPEKHRDSILYLVVSEDENTSRGIGGQNTVMLHIGKLRDEELMSVWVHEIGHVVDTGLYRGTQPSSPTNFMDGNSTVLQNDISNVFYSISWESTTKKKKGVTSLDFVSGYAMSDPFEDFAESYLFFILHGNTFRSMTKTSSKLYEKYIFLQNIVFDGQEFTTGTVLQNTKARYYDATLVPFNSKEFLQ